MKHLRILLVEDDKYFISHMREILSPYGVTEIAHDLTKARQLILANTYDLIITDLHLPENAEGIQVLRLASKQRCPKLMLTSSDNDELIHEAYQAGARHILRKNQIRENLPSYLKDSFYSENEQHLESFFEYSFPTQNSALREQISKLITRPWQGRALLITGATGTGKSVLGKALAEELLGKNAPFIHLNCSEISDSLIESELFGHEKGAFTGAENKREGKIKAADGGVLFLDEIGTMSMPMQQKLLKAIEEKSFYAVGGSKPIRSDFILITATCEDIQKKIKTGDFREDLFFRLAGLTLEIPSLRERPEDILVYTNIFKKQLARHVIISKAAQEQMQRHSWPGNLRELKQAIQSFSDRSQGIVELFQPSQSVSAHQSEEIISQEIRNYILTHGLRSYIQLVEKTMVQDLLQKHSGKITSCMKELKVSSSAMYRILQENQLKI